MDKQAYARAESAQRQLMERLEGVDGVSGVGIGLNGSRDGYVVRVLLLPQEGMMKLPRDVDGVAVEAQIVGPITLR